MTRILTTDPSAPIDEAHPELVSAVARSIDFLSYLRLAAGGDGYWAVWGDLAERAHYFAEHLSAALHNCRDGRFAAGFASARVAMEHQLLDSLLLLANRYEQRIPDMSDEDFERWQSDRSQWGTGVEDLRRSRRGAVVVRKGHDVVDPEGRVVEHVSPYVPLIHAHQPLVGPIHAQGEMFDGIGDLADREQHARENGTLYHSFLKWSAVLHNLEVNQLLSQSERVGSKFTIDFSVRSPTHPATDMK